MDERAHMLVTRHLAGEPVSKIAQEMGISRARAYQLMQQARESGEYTAQVQVVGISSTVNRDHLAQYLRRALASAGLSTQKRES